jgi:methylglutaconyl-CoA hydratase
VIAPFVLARIGASAARELFLTAARFPAVRAREIGLVHAVSPEAGLDTTIDAYVKELSTSGPEAVADAKRLIMEIAGRPPDSVTGLTTEAIARRRASPEGQAGMRAFLEKRRAPWTTGA